MQHASPAFLEGEPGRRRNVPAASGFVFSRGEPAAGRSPRSGSTQIPGTVRENDRGGTRRTKTGVSLCPTGSAYFRRVRGACEPLGGGKDVDQQKLRIGHHIVGAAAAFRDEELRQ